MLFIQLPPCAPKYRELSFNVDGQINPQKMFSYVQLFSNHNISWMISDKVEICEEKIL